MEATPEQIAAAFTEWMRRYEADPEGFETLQESLTKGADDYGQSVTPYFLAILAEVKGA